MQGIVSLCLLFETLLQTYLPQLFYHLREIGAQPWVFLLPHRLCTKLPPGEAGNTTLLLFAWHKATVCPPGSKATVLPPKVPIIKCIYIAQEETIRFLVEGWVRSSAEKHLSSLCEPLGSGPALKNTMCWEEWLGSQWVLCLVEGPPNSSNFSSQWKHLWKQIEPGKCGTSQCGLVIRAQLWHV